jgi:hypothetical protein
VQDALNLARIEYIKDGANGHHGKTKHLDFYLPEFDVYIEICAYYTARKIEQASRVDNLILLQGRKAVELFAQKISKII